MRLQRNVSTIAGLGMTQGARAFGTVGLPLFVLTVSGFYGLSHLVQGKFDVQVVSATPAPLLSDRDL